MDPLSDVLSILKPRSYMFRGLDMAGPWSLRFPAIDGIRCYALLRGECWLIVDGADEPVHLAAGDCVLLTRKQTFCLASDHGVTPLDAVGVVTQARQGGIATINGGGEFSGIGGFFMFDGKHAGVLLALLPPIVHIRKESDRAALRGSMEMMMRELREPQPGGSLVAQHLGHLMLVLALRLHLAEGTGVGWLFALADKQIGAAISAMHSGPAQRWDVHSLAQRACMSRSSFAQKFRATVGEPPMEYLLRWRMMLAADKLVNSGDSIAVIAYAVGYESDSAFSAAFRRVMGCSPRQYARSRDPDPDAASLGEGEAAAAIRFESIQN